MLVIFPLFDVGYQLILMILKYIYIRGVYYIYSIKKVFHIPYAISMSHAFTWLRGTKVGEMVSWS